MKTLNHKPKQALETKHLYIDFLVEMWPYSYHGSQTNEIRLLTLFNIWRGTK